MTQASFGTKNSAVIHESEAHKKSWDQLNLFLSIYLAATPTKYTIYSGIGWKLATILKY